MNKDVIYIDTEDDITSIIGKIKSSKSRVVALVPPKRVGILQSAVNLRLLARMAETSNKHLVIVTTNKSLMALSAAAMIPVSKNLQSKPELIQPDEIEIDDNDDVIDGQKLPIGELAKTSDTPEPETTDDAIDTINIEEFESSKSPKPAKAVTNNNPNKVKVPDFQSFRKKLFIGVFAAISIGTFMVWATIYAPAADIIVSTRTSSAPVSVSVILGGTAATSVEKNSIQTIVKQVKKDLSVEFNATGTKDMGTKATGAIDLSYANMPTKKITVEAGQEVSFGDKSFTIQSDIIISTDTAGKTGYGSGTVIASANGEGYNIAAGDCTVTESPSVGCSSDSAMTGGLAKIVNIVTEADIQKAKQVIVDMPSEAVKQQLIKQFTSGEKVIVESFTIDRADGVSVPALGAEATAGKAKLTSATTYSLTAIAKSEVQTFLRDAITKQIDNAKTQRIISDGIDTVALSGYIKTDTVATVNIATVGKIGPSIDEKYVLNVVKGKKFGDIQSTLGGVSGVTDVDVKFSYFWVSTVPTESAKIHIEFKSSNV